MISKILFLAFSASGKIDEISFDLKTLQNSTDEAKEASDQVAQVRSGLGQDKKIKN